MSIMYHFQLYKQDLEDKYRIIFDDYFSEQLEVLKSLEADGLVSISKNHITVTQIGRLLIRKMPVIFNMHTIKQGVSQF